MGVFAKKTIVWIIKSVSIFTEIQSLQQKMNYVVEDNLDAQTTLPCIHTNWVQPVQDQNLEINLQKAQF